MATQNKPKYEKAPLCECGCGTPTNWRPGKGWSSYRRGHHARGKPGPRRGAVLSATTKTKMSDAALKRYAGKRKRDFDPTGPGVYSTKEYRDARKKLVEGKPCCRCGSEKRIHAHHVTAGDDSTLIPLCAVCHAQEHHCLPEAKGRKPPPGEEPPICACGCGRPVAWKRVRGWALYCRGHANAKVAAGTKDREAPLCKCGCGETVKFRFGKGWNEYKRGHRQRVEGGYRTRTA